MHYLSSRNYGIIVIQGHWETAMIQNSIVEYVGMLAMGQCNKQGLQKNAIVAVRKI